MVFFAGYVIKVENLGGVVLGTNVDSPFVEARLVLQMDSFDEQMNEDAFSMFGNLLHAPVERSNEESSMNESASLNRVNEDSSSSSDEPSNIFEVSFIKSRCPFML